MTRREFHYTDGQSDKFWAIALHDTAYTIHFGRRGTAGQQQVKEFTTSAAAAAAYNKAIATKLKQGYVEIQPVDFLLDALNRIKQCIHQQVPAATDYFQPGLSREAMDAALAEFPYVLPDEVYQLYGWHNGISVTQEFGLFPTYLFLPLEECLAEYQQTLKVYQELSGVDDWENLYDPRWFPLFCEEGNYYVVPGAAAPSLAAPILDKFSEDPDVRPLFDNVTQLMQAVAECWETGIYQIEQSEDGSCYGVAADDTAANRIWLKYQSQRSLHVETVLAQDAASLTSEQQLAAYRDLVATRHPDALVRLQQALEALQTTSHGNVEHYCQIVYCVGELRSPTAVLTLLPLLNHREPEIQLAVLTALVWRVGYEIVHQTPGLEEWVDRLLDLLQEEALLLGQANIVTLLGMTGDRRAYQPLVEVLNRSQSAFFDRDIKFAAIKALTRLRDVSAAEPLHHFAWGDSDPTLCLAAGRALRALDDPRGTTIIQRLIEAGLPTISEAARRVLALEPDEFLKFG